jgi:hypothetical protein
MTAALISLALLLSAWYVSRVIKRAIVILYDAIMRSAVIANFSRYGDFEDVKVAIINDESAYFIRESALWHCKVEDDVIDRSTARIVDAVNVTQKQLEDIIEAVEALNTEY